MSGIQETKEALIAINEIAVFLVQRLKDGVDINDVIAIWDKLKDDEEFKSKLEAGWKNIKDVPAEIKDIDIMEGVELSMLQIQYIPKYVEAFKKE